MRFGSTLRIAGVGSSISASNNDRCAEAAFRGKIRLVSRIVKFGVEGSSQRGFGLVGVTSANPASSNGRVAGLYGKDQGATRSNSGGSAFSQNGTGSIAFGVLGDGIDGITTATAGGASASAVQGADNGQNVASTGVPYDQWRHVRAHAQLGRR